ncbi:MAG: prepilin peptidase [Alphaproteobacteria bacterium]|nr:prepilin peptidase [Alphaproteobacteria bacterium]
MLTAIAAVVGLAVGSFLGTLALRLPRGLPVVGGRSVCPHCGHRLTAPELVPLASWFLQRGRCRACGARLSIFYPAIELAAALVAAICINLSPAAWGVLACLAGWAALAVLARVVVGARTL